MLQTSEAWQSVVLGGALADRGMISFAKYLTPKDAENIRAFVLSEAKKIP